MTKQTYLLDLDGPVYNLDGPLDAFMEARGFPLQNPELYTLDTRYGIRKGDSTGKEILTYFITQKRALRDIPLFEGSLEAIKKLNDSGNLHIVTARGTYGEIAKQDTCERLLRECPFLSKEQILFEQEKGKQAKRLGITDSFEDWLINANDILEKSNSHIHLIDKPYNQTSSHPRITRHNSLAEAVNSIISF
ncbi:MAG: hypothetical protein V1888_01605 [archaeon]